ncbi:hypothetical protein JI752_008045 [Lysobacter sp. MMG2]|uniref:hypothetical protein n=1 Tax=Lysobacter sp. MMG2 TaxID=2801338 RepID=UPI001C23F0DC|nr:hypothetical protein [Lysobacter sp. MMG2]MBU8976096.1 hypothetical protein [Lysobacter sp. MMG2]
MAASAVALAALAAVYFYSLRGVDAVAPYATQTSARLPDSKSNERSTGDLGQEPQANPPVQRQKAAHYTPLSNLTPILGDAAQVIDALTPAAKSGDTSAALAIFVKANDCRLRTEAAKRNAPSSTPTALIPPDCQSLAPEDYTAAGQWLEAAADAGNVDAQFLYPASAEGVLGPPVDWLRHPEAVANFKRKAMAYMNANAAKGSIDALLDLSNAYEYGVLTERDPVKALAYYRAVELSDGNAISQRSLAYLKQNLSPTDVTNAENLARSIHANCCE